MVTPQRLSEALHLSKVDLEDLVQVLTWHFGGARYEQEREIGFPNAGEPMVTLRFSKDLRRCDAAVPGSPLDEAGVKALETKVVEELLQSTGLRYGTTVLYSLEPVDGFWRYEDRLQLRPVPPESPRPTFLYADHPLLMDFTYSGSGDVTTNARRRQRAATRWAHRLNVLVKPGLEMPSGNARHVWVVVPGPEGTYHSQFLPEGYWPEGSAHDESRLVEPASDAIDRATAAPYYTASGTALGPLKLPDTLERSVAAIEGLPADALLRFDRAAYWFHYATHVAQAHSVSAVALGATIEAMFEPTTMEQCRECGADRYRPTARFIDFMSANLPGSDADGARHLFGEFYSLRSRPAHGHVMDFDFLPVPSFVPARLAEDGKMRSLFGLVRLALVHWLDARAPSPTAQPEAASIV